MPSYKNFRNEKGRNIDSDSMFKNPPVRLSNDLTEERKERLMEWITFYRRNVHRFVEHYFGIKLYPYQVMWIYLMGISDSFVAICSRGTAKSWLVGVLACARAVLYPNSEIVVVSSTKAQAGIIIQKIFTMKNDHPNLAREIDKVVTNMNLWEVTFHNGSSIRVVASRDSSRGARATFIIYEEFRLIDKDILDSVIRPTAYIRQTPYLHKKEYENLGEEPKEVFISSAYHKGLWWFDETKKNINAMLKGEKVFFIALDYLLTIEHHIKTKRQIKNERSKMDEITALEEYDNIPWGESSDAYFKLKMFEKARKVSKAFYPQRIITYNSKKNPYNIPKTEGELRIVTCDIAQRAGVTNDLSISSCIRLLPTTRGYFRELNYLESVSGKNSILQALRIKQLWHDFEADYIVLDITSAGITVVDSLGQITKDEERDIEYPAMTVFPHDSLDQKVIEELTKRTLGINALPIIYPISATAKLNSQIAVEFRDKLQKKMWGFLYDQNKAEDYLIGSSNSKEFLEDQAFFISPYVQTDLLINECINLSASWSLGNVKLTEPSGGRKDRYSSVSYGNYFISFFDQDLIRDEDMTDDFDYLLSMIQST
jgi:hypothetical protein